MGKVKKKILLRLIISVAILFFSLWQLIYASLFTEPLIFIVAFPVFFLSSQYTILNLLYYLKNLLRVEDSKIFIKVGNLEILTEKNHIKPYKLEKPDFYIFEFEKAELKILKPPALSKILIKTPNLFLYSFLGCYSYPMFFNKEEDLQKYYETNESIFGEKVVISKELVGEI